MVPYVLHPYEFLDAYLFVQSIHGDPNLGRKTAYGRRMGLFLDMYCSMFYGIVAYFRNWIKDGYWFTDTSLSVDCVKKLTKRDKENIFSLSLSIIDVKLVASFKCCWPKILSRSVSSLVNDGGCGCCSSATSARGYNFIFFVDSYVLAQAEQLLTVFLHSSSPEARKHPCYGKISAGKIHIGGAQRYMAFFQGQILFMFSLLEQFIFILSESKTIWKNMTLDTLFSPLYVVREIPCTYPAGHRNLAANSGALCSPNSV